MAELSDDVVERLIDALKAKVDSGQAQARTSELRGIVEAFKTGDAKAVKDYIAAQKDGSKSTAALTRDIDSLNKEIDKETDAMRKSQLEATKRAMQEKSLDLQKTADWKKSSDGIKAAFGTASSQIVSAGGNLVKSLQDGSNGFDTTKAVLGAGADLIGSTTKSAGEGLKSVGGALSAVPGPAMAVGAALTGLGFIVGFAGDKVSKFAKFGVDVLDTEVKKTIKTFNDTTSAGALFTDGMTGMRNAAAEAGVDTETFSSVLKSQSGTLAQAGLGVTEGAVAVGRVGKIFDQNGGKVRQELLNLGYSFQDQAAITAEVIGDMARLNPGKQLNSQAVAEQTQKYAENLRLITAITGEDAKKKMEEARQAANNLAFQQKLATMTPKQQQEIDAAMMAMSAQQKKNFMDTMVFGTVINKSGAIMEAQLPAMADGTRRFADLANRGALNARTAAETQGEISEAIRKQALDATGIGQAGLALQSGVAQDLSTGMLDQIKIAGQYTKEGVQKSLSDLAGQKDTADPLTKSVTAAEQAAMNLKVTIQDTLTPAIARYAEFTETMLKSLGSAMDAAGIAHPKIKEGPSTTKSAESEGPSYLSGLMEIPKGITSAISNVADLVGSAVRGVTGIASPKAENVVVSNPENVTKKVPGAATGAVLSGPTSGFFATLHGTEVVMPVPKGMDVSLSRSPTSAIGRPSGPDSASEIDTALSKIDSMMGPDVTSATRTIQERSNPMAGADLPFKSIADSVKSMFDSFSLPKAAPEKVTTDFATTFPESKMTPDTSPLLKEQIDLLKQFIRKADELLTVANDQKSLTRNILNATL